MGNPIVLLLSLGVIGLFSSPAQAAQELFDALIVHARVYGASSSTVDAVAVKQGRIAKLGRSGELTQYCRTGCKTIDARGAFLMPGFHDSHAHPTSGGAGFYRLKVWGSSVSSIAEAVRQYAQSHPELPWIIGRGWNAAGFGGRYPNRMDLDAAEAGRPVVLIDSDGHQVWTNSAAIRAAEVDRNTPDPEGGRVVRDENGEPTGIFLEKAVDLIAKKIPEATDEQRRKYILKGEEYGLNSAFTSVHGGSVGLAMMQTYAQMDQEKLLKQRVFLWADLKASDQQFSDILNQARLLEERALSGGRVRVVAFKGFVDGVISSYTAAMLEPYSDNPTVKGDPEMDQETLNRLVLRANAAGFPVALHAIGDRGVRMALNAYQYSKEVLKHSLLNRVEHIETLSPEDAPRFGRLGVAASMQPSHMHFGSASSSYYPSRIGNERLHHAFAWAELQKAGALLLFGTDFPVVDQDLMEGIYCAINRTYGNGTPFEPQQKIDPDAAIAAFTRNPALSVGAGQSLGQIREGYFADLVMLSKDPREGIVSSIGQNPPLMLMIAGQVLE